ncbi:unnamed protein product, partial [Ranitomeya imitator]
MSSNVAPPYANSYMAQFEEEVVYPDPLFQAYCPMWRRCIEDVFCIWMGTSQTLNLFFHNLNTALPGLSFTITSSSQQVNFLDTLSLHPISLKKSIPRSQFKRVQRIVTEPTLIRTRTDEMYNKFRERGYPLNLLLDAINSPTIPCPSVSKRIPLVHVYHPYVHILHHTIRQHWNMLRTALPGIPEFQERFLPCYKRPSNVRDSLVRADFGGRSHNATQQFLNKPKHGTFPCLHCNQCNNVIRGDSFFHPHSGKKYKIKIVLAAFSKLGKPPNQSRIAFPITSRLFVIRTCCYHSHFISSLKGIVYHKSSS